MNHHRWLAFLAGLAALILSGCVPRGGLAPTAVAAMAVEPSLTAPVSPMEASTPTPQPAQPAAPLTPVLNPLTGLPLEQPERTGQRPIIIKVSNFPRNNRPQWGLSFADIVFEHYAEGGLSRFSALFYGQEAEMVGPIRSGRLVDLELIEMYSAIFAYGSADYRVRDAIAASEFAARAVSEYPARCPPMCRYDSANLNHLFTNTLELRAYLAEQGQAPVSVNLEGIQFDRMPPAAGEAGVELELHYSVGNFHRWVYDPNSRAYFRWQETGKDELQVAPLEDRLTGVQVAAANVILVIVPHTYVSQTPEFIRIDLEGSGRALAFRDGQKVEIRWLRPSEGGVLQFLTEEGLPFGLRPGPTWIEMVNTSAEVEARGNGAWWVRNHLP